MKQEVIRKASQQPEQTAPNLTGIPIQMKLEAEAKTGKSYDSVRVTYHSDVPDQYDAAGITRAGPKGPEIFLKSGETRHLKHELVHANQVMSGVVRPTGTVNGIPLNDDLKLEQDADMGRYIQYGSTQPGGSALIQRKMSVAASLSLDPGGVFQASQFTVDSIKLSDRADTGLKAAGGGKTQGDHTIADALVKKYQKVMVRGRPLLNVFMLYYNLFREIEKGNELYQGPPKPIEEMEDQGEAAFWESQPNRIQQSNKICNEGLEFISDPLANTKQTGKEHRQDLVEVIKLYNDAYAHSFLATQGYGTGGHGENAGMQAVRKTLKHGDISTDLLTLIDFDSTFKLQNPAASQAIYLKYAAMLGSMLGYGEGGTDERGQAPIYTDQVDYSGFLDPGFYAGIGQIDPAILEHIFTTASSETFVIFQTVSKFFSQLQSQLRAYNQFVAPGLDSISPEEYGVELRKIFQELPTELPPEINEAYRTMYHSIVIEAVTPETMPQINDLIHETFGNLYAEIGNYIASAFQTRPGTPEKSSDVIEQYLLSVMQSNSSTAISVSIEDMVRALGIDRAKIMSYFRSKKAGEKWNVQAVRENETGRRYIGYNIWAKTV